MSDNLPWKTWTPDDLAPPPAEFVPMAESEETIIEEVEPSLELSYTARWLVSAF